LAQARHQQDGALLKDVEKLTQLEALALQASQQESLIKREAAQALEEKTRFLLQSAQVERDRRDLERQLSLEQQRRIALEQNEQEVIAQKLLQETELAEVTCLRVEAEKSAQALVLQTKNAEQALFDAAAAHAKAQALGLQAVGAKLRDVKQLTDLENQRATLEFEALSVVQEKLALETKAMADAALRLEAEQEYLQQYALRAQAEHEMKMALQQKLHAEVAARELAQQAAVFEQELALAAQAHLDNLLQLQHVSSNTASLENEKNLQLQLQYELQKKNEELERLALQEITNKLELEKQIQLEAEKRLSLERDATEASTARAMLEQSASAEQLSNLEREQQLAEISKEVIAKQKAYSTDLCLQIVEQEKLSALEDARCQLQIDLKLAIEQRHLIEQKLSEEVQHSLDAERATAAALQARLAHESQVRLDLDRAFEEEQNASRLTQDLQHEYQTRTLQNQEQVSTMQQQLQSEHERASALAENLIAKLMQQQGQSQAWRENAQNILANSPVEVVMPNIPKTLPGFRMRTSVVLSAFACAGIVGAVNWGLVQAQTQTKLSSVSVPQVAPVKAEVLASATSSAGLRMSYGIDMAPSKN
jgi:hypothetical protein